MMTLNENEKSLHTVKRQFNYLMVHDEKDNHRDNASLQPPSYEALSGTASNPGSLDPIATPSTAIRSTRAPTLPCVIPREVSLEPKHRMSTY
jgi:hypothetical protein